MRAIVLNYLDEKITLLKRGYYTPIVYTWLYMENERRFIEKREKKYTLTEGPGSTVREEIRWAGQEEERNNSQYKNSLLFLVFCPLILSPFLSIFFYESNLFYVSIPVIGKVDIYNIENILHDFTIWIFLTENNFPPQSIRGIFSPSPEPYYGKLN